MTQEQESNQEQEGGQGQETQQQQPQQQQGGTTSPAGMLDFLRQSNIINLDMPLRSLFEGVQNLQPDPSTGWGIIGDSGHWVLVWKGKE